MSCEEKKTVAAAMPTIKMVFIVRGRGERESKAAE